MGSRRMKTTSCRIPNTKERKPPGRSIKKPFTESASVFCPAPNRQRSKRETPRCNKNNLSTKHADKRRIILDKIKEDAQDAAIFQAIDKIEVGQTITKANPLIVVNNKDLLN